MPEIYGNVSGLAPRAIKALERVYRRRVPADTIFTPELARSLAEASRESKRQVGALVHRSGQVDYVVVGNATGIMLPDIGRLRAADGRFRALRLIHTHLFAEPLTRDDLTDLTRLRLDLVAAILLNLEGEPRSVTWAYNTPGTLEGAEPSYQVEGPFPWGHPSPNFGELISALEDEFRHKARTRSTQSKDGRAILIHVGEKRTRDAARHAHSRLTELESLARTAGVDVIDKIQQLRDSVDPKFVLGRGRLEQVVLRAIEQDVETLIFDCNLSPTQVSSIASKTDLRVIDRTQLILDIFAQRAQTRDGKAQVELAQLKYSLPKLGTKDDALSRLTGGIGGRGPGETKLEVGRRRARERIDRLERELRTLSRQRSERRRKRGAGSVPVVAIVGYTNAGKSTLLNTLTHAGVLAEDKLFATLETRARRLRLPSGLAAVLTDTVGFIRDMPKDLFAAFRSTFEETADADLLLEVLDASDPEMPAHLSTTDELLRALELDSLPRLRIFNKIDLVDSETREAIEHGSAGVPCSALGKEGTARLVAWLEHNLPRVSDPTPAVELDSENVSIS
ncbi:MAG: GTPase HflX [Polyangiaceae bacterium]|nr:GTPase HflX [Polyangiaceae bacterium]